MLFTTPPFSRPGIVAFSIRALFLSSLVAAQTDTGNECNCFLTNGSSSAYFTYHRFHDFRNVNVSLASSPDVFIDATNTTNADVTSSFFSDHAWTFDWDIQAWNNSDSIVENNASVLMINSANNVYIEKSIDEADSYSTYLTLRTTRTPDFQSAAEIDSTEQNLQYLSARFLARVIGSPGSCAGMFTYLSSDPVQEADIEILTSGPRNVVQYTNQPSNSASGDILPDATSNATIPGGLDWSTWNAYRLDWTPTQSSWYVNGESAANISFQVPRDPAGLILNMWSDGGPWTGNMTLHDAAYLQVQYIEIVYNTSGPYVGSSSTTSTGPRKAEETALNGFGHRSQTSRGDEKASWLSRKANGPVDSLRRREKHSEGCQIVCSIDENINSSSAGTPFVLYNNTGAAASYKRPENWYGWVPGMVFGAFVSLALCL